jgi:hypothetical protein
LKATPFLAGVGAGWIAFSPEANFSGKVGNLSG